MSNAILNDSLAFLPYPYRRDVIGFKASILESAAGNQTVIPHSGHDRLRISLDLSLFTSAERDPVINFYKSRLGSQQSFLFRDREELFVAKVAIATAIAGQTKFQMAAAADGNIFHRWDIDKISTGAPADPQIWKDAALLTETTDYTIVYNESGELTLNTPCSGGEVIYNEMYFFRRMRFTGKYSDVLQRFEDVHLPLTMDEVVVVP